MFKNRFRHLSSFVLYSTGLRLFANHTVPFLKETRRLASSLPQLAILSIRQRLPTEEIRVRQASLLATLLLLKCIWVSIAKLRAEFGSLDPSSWGWQSLRAARRWEEQCLGQRKAGEPVASEGGISLCLSPSVFTLGAGTGPVLPRWWGYCTKRQDGAPAWLSRKSTGS